MIVRLFAAAAVAVALSSSIASAQWLRPAREIKAETNGWGYIPVENTNVQMVLDWLDEFADYLNSSSFWNDVTIDASQVLVNTQNFSVLVGGGTNTSQDIFDDIDDELSTEQLSRASADVALGDQIDDVNALARLAYVNSTNWFGLKSMWVLNGASPTEYSIGLSEIVAITNHVDSLSSAGVFYGCADQAAPPNEDKFWVTCSGVYLVHGTVSGYWSGWTSNAYTTGTVVSARIIQAPDGGSPVMVQDLGSFIDPLLFGFTGTPPSPVGMSRYYSSTVVTFIPSNSYVYLGLEASTETGVPAPGRARISGSRLDIFPLSGTLNSSSNIPYAH